MKEQLKGILHKFDLLKFVKIDEKPIWKFRNCEYKGQITL